MPMPQETGLGTACSAEGRGASSVPFCLLQGALPPFLLTLSWAAAWASLQGGVPRLQNNRPSILPSPGQTYLLCYSPACCCSRAAALSKGPGEQAWGLVCPLTPESPAETEITVSLTAFGLGHLCKQPLPTTLCFPQMREICPSLIFTPWARLQMFPDVNLQLPASGVATTGRRGGG